MFINSLTQIDVRENLCTLLNSGIAKDDLEYNLEIMYSAFKRSSTKKALDLCRSRLISVTKKYYGNTINYSDFTLHRNMIIDQISNIIDISTISEMGGLPYFEEEHGIVYLCKDDSNTKFKYIGKMKDGKPSGFGQAVYINGDRYKGNFKNGLKSGEGKYYSSDNKLLFYGNWDNGIYSDEGLIRYYSEIFASAGELGGKYFDDSNNFSYINIPEIKNYNLEFAFPVNGNSMEPDFLDGQIVVCEKISNPRDYIIGLTYVIINDGECYLKIINKASSRRDYGLTLNLRSTNSVDHPDFDIDVNEYTTLFRVVASIGYHV